MVDDRLQQRPKLGRQCSPLLGGNRRGILRRHTPDVANFTTRAKTNSFNNSIRPVNDYPAHGI